MLIYHPAFDAYHCAFRILVVTDRQLSLEFAKLRILDFYLCFPAEVANVQIPQEDIDVKKIARDARNPYRGPVSSFRTFRELEPIQHAAARMLAASGILDSDQLEQGLVVRTGAGIVPELARVIAGATREMDDVLSYVLNRMSKIPLTGQGGLKQRTGLMEYRYDPA